MRVDSDGPFTRSDQTIVVRQARHIFSAHYQSGYPGPGCLPLLTGDSRADGNGMLLNEWFLVAPGKTDALRGCPIPAAMHSEPGRGGAVTCVNTGIFT